MPFERDLGNLYQSLVHPGKGCPGRWSPPGLLGECIVF